MENDTTPPKTIPIKSFSKEIEPHSGQTLWKTIPFPPKSVHPDDTHEFVVKTHRTSQRPKNMENDTTPPVNRYTLNHAHCKAKLSESTNGMENYTQAFQ